MLSKIAEVFRNGGYTLVIMLLCSIAAVAVSIERAVTLWNFLGQARRLADAVRRALYRGAVAEARTACERSRSPVADIFLAGFERISRKRPAGDGAPRGAMAIDPREALSSAVDRERQRVALSLKGPLWVLGTVGAVAPFVGLFGTVVGIMSAFRVIGESKRAGIEVVGPYIAEALIATAVGIGVAVVALVCFNFFQSRLSRINIELKLTAEEFVELLAEQGPGAETSATAPASTEAG